MISIKLKYKILFVSILTIALHSCSNPWDARQDNGDINLSANLGTAISNTKGVSLFSALLVQTGYDKVLASSKSYTVFAPTDEAIYKLDKSIINDSKALSFFVSNHIALTIFSSVRSQSKVKILMLSGKYLEFNGTTTIGDASILTPDKYASNGIYHIIDKALNPKINIWQYINTQTSSSLMSKYLVSLKELNIYRADSIAKISAVPGALSDSLSNSYLRNVYNLNNEKNSYTIFLMDDTGYTAEVDKLSPYLIKSNAARSATYSSYFTTRDLVFPKAYLPGQLPAVLTSRFGIEVPIDKTQIVGDPIILSNGIVYRIKRVDVPLTNRLVTNKIEGENNNSFFPTNLRSKIFYRDKQDLFGFNYKDIMVQNPTVSLFTLNYNNSGKDFFSTTYKVYWRAINDVQTNVFQQKLLIGTGLNGIMTGTLKDFGYIDIPVSLYDEVYLGDVEITQAGSLDFISLIAANNNINGNNSLTLDYLKFVPVLK
jgi:hypothetical protein